MQSSGLLLSHIATIPLRGFVTAAMADEVSAFFTANPVPAASMGIAQAIEGIRARAACADRSVAGIAEFLEEWAKTQSV